MVAAFKKKNTLEQTGFALSDGGFTYCNKPYRFDDVIETRIFRSVLEHKGWSEQPKFKRDSGLRYFAS